MWKLWLVGSSLILIFVTFDYLICIAYWSPVLAPQDKVTFSVIDYLRFMIYILFIDLVILICLAFSSIRALVSLWINWFCLCQSVFSRLFAVVHTILTLRVRWVASYSLLPSPHYFRIFQLAFYCVSFLAFLLNFSSLSVGSVSFFYVVSL